VLVRAAEAVAPTLAQTLPTTPLATIWPDLAAVCLFSLLGLTLVVLSCVSSETISIMSSSFIG
jgi:hypothetical protein